jgi:NAD-dependent dihydropyrimidine dehydrogenase PreA subunit
MLREIVKIDEELCDGCGLCVPGCHEGALQIIEGKARLISELMCDGLGACLGHCPQDAITIETREAEEYDEVLVMTQMVKSGKATVFAHLKHLQEHNENEYLNQALSFIKANRDTVPFTIKEVHDLLHGNTEKQHPYISGGCPGSAAVSFNASDLKMVTTPTELPSALSQWPVQLHLINPAAAYFQRADLLVAADCAAFAYGNFHQKFMTGKKLVIACPKLDQGTDVYIQKFNRLIDEAQVNTITVVIMEVPCCGGLISMIQTALSHSGRKVPVKIAVIGTRGEILSDDWVL